MVERVLVVAPHPDDEAIGCGGVILRHRQQGDPVRTVFLTSGERGIPGVAAEPVRAVREAEAEAAAEILGVGRLDFLRLPDLGVQEQLAAGCRRLRTLLEADPPTLIYLPHPRESHPDHAAALPLVRRALAPWSLTASLPRLTGYEVWSPLVRADCIQDITEVVRHKWRAMRCYPSQLRFVRYDQAVRGLNRYRAVMAGVGRYAEAFLDLDPHLPDRERRDQAFPEGRLADPPMTPAG
jgi:LmbE family N-acetylglucosaminyl deacetylase